MNCHVQLSFPISAYSMRESNYRGPLPAEPLSCQNRHWSGRVNSGSNVNEFKARLRPRHGKARQGKARHGGDAQRVRRGMDEHGLTRLWTVSSSSDQEFDSRSPFSKLRHRSHCGSPGPEDWVRMQRVFAAAHEAQAAPHLALRPVFGLCLCLCLSILTRLCKHPSGPLPQNLGGRSLGEFRFRTMRRPRKIKTALVSGVMQVGGKLWRSFGR